MIERYWPLATVNRVFSAGAEGVVDFDCCAMVLQAGMVSAKANAETSVMEVQLIVMSKMPFLSIVETALSHVLLRYCTSIEPSAPK